MINLDSILKSRDITLPAKVHLVKAMASLVAQRLKHLPPIPPSIKVFSNESTLHMRWPKYWSFSLSISPSNEHQGLISFRMDWLDLLAVQIGRAHV